MRASTSSSHAAAPPAPELRYGVAEPAWGRGLATEIARAVLEDARTRLGMRELRASTNAPNAASISVLRRLGFRQERRTVVDGVDTLFFRLGLPAR